jgi:hypothetical protein
MSLLEDAALIVSAMLAFGVAGLVLILTLISFFQ